MTLYEFNLLDTDERTAVAMQGKFIDVRLEVNLKVALYSHPAFFAEVFYDGESNQIMRCRAFTLPIFKKSKNLPSQNGMN